MTPAEKAVIEAAVAYHEIHVHMIKRGCDCAKCVLARAVASLLRERRKP